MSFCRAARLLAILAAVAGTGAFSAATRAETFAGKIEKIDGANVTLSGRTIALSAARTNVCLKGICDQAMDRLKPGMTCSAEVADRSGTAEVRRLACR